MSSQARQEFFTFARAKKLRHIFLEAEDLLGSNQESLAEFIEDASVEKMAITLLAGDPQWTLPEKHSSATELAKTACKFIRSLKASRMPAPSTFQFDIEPYLLDQWDLELDETANFYLDLLLKLKSALAGEIALQVAVPLWFQNIPLYRQDCTKPLTDWIAGCVDKMVLIDHEAVASEILQPSEEQQPMLAVYPSNDGYCVFSLDAWSKRSGLMAAKGRLEACPKGRKRYPGKSMAHKLLTKRIIYG